MTTTSDDDSVIVNEGEEDKETDLKSRDKHSTRAASEIHG